MEAESEKRSVHELAKESHNAKSPPPQKKRRAPMSSHDDHHEKNEVCERHGHAHGQAHYHSVWAPCEEEEEQEERRMNVGAKQRVDGIYSATQEQARKNIQKLRRRQH